MGHLSFQYSIPPFHSTSDYRQPPFHSTSDSRQPPFHSTDSHHSIALVIPGSHHSIPLVIPDSQMLTYHCRLISHRTGLGWQYVPAPLLEGSFELEAGSDRRMSGRGREDNMKTTPTVAFSRQTNKQTNTMKKPSLGLL